MWICVYVRVCVRIHNSPNFHLLASIGGIVSHRWHASSFLHFLPSFLPSSHPPIHPSIFPKSVFRYNSRRIAQPPCDRPLDRATHLSSVRRDLVVKSIHHNRPRATAIDRRVSDRSLDDWDLIVFVYWWYLLIRRFYLFVVFVYLLYLLFRKTVNFLRC